MQENGSMLNYNYLDAGMELSSESSLTLAPIDHFW